MSRRDGTFKIRQDKPIKNCGTTVITPRTKGDVPAAKTVRNVHTIEPPKPLFPKILNYTIPTDNITEPLISIEGKEWTDEKIKSHPKFEEVKEVVQELLKDVDLVEGPEIPLITPPTEDVSTGKPIVDKVEVPPIVPIPSVADIDKAHEEQLIPEQEEALLKQRAEEAVSPNPIEAVKKHTRGRKKKEEVVSNEDTTLSPANNEDNKE